MFRDDAQISSAVLVLLHSVQLERLWTAAGPTNEAVELADKRGGPMSHGEALIVLVAFDFWNGHGHARLDELLAVLDPDRIRLVATLMIAAAEGGEAVDRWLSQHRGARLRSV